MVRPEELISLLNLKPLPEEGGCYVETYRCDEHIPVDALPYRYSGVRSFGTAIYYLLTADTFSTLHRLASDEIFHFYLGDPVEMLQLYPDGSGKVIALGHNIPSGQQPQVVVPRGVWQGARLIPGGKFALMGTTVAPGFEYTDYEGGQREELVRAYPQFRELITALTRAEPAGR